VHVINMTNSGVIELIEIHSSLFVDYNFTSHYFGFR
jgi:hypothetical protein